MTLPRRTSVSTLLYTARSTAIGAGALALLIDLTGIDELAPERAAVSSITLYVARHALTNHLGTK